MFYQLEPEALLSAPALTPDALAGVGFEGDPLEAAPKVQTHPVGAYYKSFDQPSARDMCCGAPVEEKP